jgi:hypothetical protein
METVGKQNEFKIIGLSKEEAVEVNMVQDEIKRLHEIHKTNLKQYDDVLETLESEKWFLQHAKKRLSLKEQNTKYENFRSRQIELTEKQIAIYKGLRIKEQHELDVTKGFLNEFDTNVIIKEEDGKTMFYYNIDFYMVILQFAKTIGFAELR